MEQDVAASGLEHVIFRPSFVFGKDGGVLPTFVRQVRLLAGRDGARPGHGAAAADLGRRRRRALRARDRPAGRREPHVRARRPRAGELERALPPDREACSASAARSSTSRSPVARTGARLTQWIPALAAQRRPGDDARGGRQRRVEQRRGRRPSACRSSASTSRSAAPPAERDDPRKRPRATRRRPSNPVTSLDFVEALPADCLRSVSGAYASPPRWLGDSPSGPGDTPLRAGTSTARTGNLHLPDHLLSALPTL